VVLIQQQDDFFSGILHPHLLGVCCWTFYSGATAELIQGKASALSAEGMNLAIVSSSFIEVVDGR
jgi:hypothetical protein